MNLFHKHLDECTQCREHPFDLCATGDLLLRTPLGGVVTYIPPMWLCNRAIVRAKTELKAGPTFVLRRLRLNESRETSTVELLPVSACPDVLENYGMAKLHEAERDAQAIRLTLDVVERDYEATGKTMSILRAPL